MEGPKEVMAKWVCEACKGTQINPAPFGIPTGWSVAAVGEAGRTGIQAFDKVDRHILCPGCSVKALSFMRGEGPTALPIQKDR